MVVEFFTVQELVKLFVSSNVFDILIFLEDFGLRDSLSILISIFMIVWGHFRSFRDHSVINMFELVTCLLWLSVHKNCKLLEK